MIEHLKSNWKNVIVGNLASKEYLYFKVRKHPWRHNTKSRVYFKLFGVLNSCGLMFCVIYFHHLMAKLREMIFPTLYVNCKNKFCIFFELYTKAKEVALDRAYMTYLPHFKRMIPSLLRKVKTGENLFREFYHLDFILEYKFRKIILSFFNREIFSAKFSDLKVLWNVHY